MHSQPEHRSRYLAVLAVLWCGAVLVAYFAYNADYYRYKIAVFGRFFASSGG